MSRLFCQKWEAYRQCRSCGADTFVCHFSHSPSPNHPLLVIPNGRSARRNLLSHALRSGGGPHPRKILISLVSETQVSGSECNWVYNG
jgi:hypothetical protein